MTGSLKRGEQKCRITVRDRSGGLCEICYLAEAIHMHHRKNRSQGGTWTAENIMHVCLECHNRVGAHPAESYRCGWSVRSGHDPLTTPVLRRREWVLLDDQGGVI